MWKRILLRAGVRYRYPYQMRQPYASMMLQAGESVMWVAQQMGHTNWSFTARTYSRWVSIDAPKSYCQIWCIPMKSSGDLVGLLNFFSVNELHSLNDFCQVSEAA